MQGVGRHNARRSCARPRTPAEKGARVAAEVKTCINCQRPLADRVEEEQRTGSTGSASTGQCDTYRIWFCVNPDCVMFNTDLYKDPIAQS